MLVRCRLVCHIRELKIEIWALPNWTLFESKLTVIYFKAHDFLENFESFAQNFGLSMTKKSKHYSASHPWTQFLPHLYSIRIILNPAQSVLYLYFVYIHFDINWMGIVSERFVFFHIKRTFFCCFCYFALIFTQQSLLSKLFRWIICDSKSRSRFVY